MDGGDTTSYGSAQCRNWHRLRTLLVLHKPHLGGRRLCQRRHTTQFDGNLLLHSANAKRAAAFDAYADANRNCDVNCNATPDAVTNINRDANSKTYTTTASHAAASAVALTWVE